MEKRNLGVTFIFLYVMSLCYADPIPDPVPEPMDIVIEVKQIVNMDHHFLELDPDPSTTTATTTVIAVNATTTATTTVIAVNVTRDCRFAFDLSQIGILSNEEMEKMLIYKLSEFAKTCMGRPIIDESTYNPSPEDIEFRLYTSRDPYQYTRLIANDDNSVNNSSLNSSQPMLVVVHGFMESGNEMWIHDIKDKWMEKKPMNVILVDWHILASSPLAGKNTQFVGAELAKLLNFVKNYTGLLPSATHIIGYSLGAHVAGIAGYHLQNLARITGLDPAGILFYYAPLNMRLDPSDADFVDVIHTNGGSILTGHIGYKSPLGHVDFYMNGGSSQYGCPSSNLMSLLDIIRGNPDKSIICSHDRAHKYYIESFNAPEPSYGYLCEDYDTFENGLCLNNQHNSVGYGVTQNVTRIFYTNTQAEFTFLTRSILINLTVADGENIYYGQVIVIVKLQNRKDNNVKMISGNTGVQPGQSLTKLVTVPSGKTLNSTLISVQYQKHNTSPEQLAAKTIEAYDAFEEIWYCVSGPTDLQDDVVNIFNPIPGRC